MHLHFRWAFDLATSPGIADAVEAVLGPDVLIWATELFAKHPADPLVSVAWHRDRTYMRFDSSSCVTAWVALSPSTPENGCLQVIPGSGRCSRIDRFDAAIDVVLSPGEMSLHDSDVLHGSHPNTSSIKRVGFAIRFVTPAVLRHLPRDTSIVQVRGTPGSDWKLVDRPSEPSEWQALEAMKESATSHLDAILHNLRPAADGHS